MSTSIVRFRLALIEDAPTVRAYDQKEWALLPDGESAPVEVSLDFLQYSIRHLVTTGQGSQVAREVAAFGARWTRINVKPWSPHRTTAEPLLDTSVSVVELPHLRSPG